MKLNIGCGPIILAGFVNLDIIKDFEIPFPSTSYPNTTFVGGWDVRKDLKDYKTDSIEAITISHVLYNIEEKDYSHIFSELYRVLIPGGVLRITEDNHDQTPELLEKYNLNRDAVLTRITRFMTFYYLVEAGFMVHDVSNRTTFYKDYSLIQKIHGDSSKCFWIEGVKV